MDCPCLIADENGNCVDCGKPIENPEFRTSQFPDWKPLNKEFMDAYALVDLGDIPAICTLAEATWKEYDRRATANEEPNRPQVPRMQFVDGRFMRIPFHQIWMEVVGGSFDEAKKLGYYGGYKDWQQLVKDYAPREPHLEAVN